MEISKLGDNVLHPVVETDGCANSTNVANDTNTVNGSKPEFWIFEGAEEIFSITKDFAAAIGPSISAPIGSIITPTIVQGIKLAQQESQFDLKAALRRSLLADSTLLAAESSQGKEEGFWDAMTNIIANPTRVLQPVGAPFIKLPFKEVMDTINVGAKAADKLVDDIASEVTHGFLLASKIQSVSINGQTNKQESSMNADAPGATTCASHQHQGRGPFRRYRQRLTTAVLMHLAILCPTGRNSL